ncbi:MAG TPA: hypothetical protein PKM97_01415 [Bacteroidia bacterium]|nr:hypothetical protein [Bacteroidia bacterium]
MFLKVNKSLFTLFLLLTLVYTIAISCKSKTKDNKEIENPTFSEHIAPIIHKKCTPCHRPCSAAPIDLINYTDVKSKLRTVQLSIQSGLMPPWPADPDYVSFRDEKALSPSQKKMIDRWIENGAPEGDPSLYPAPPDYPSESTLGTPDLVIKIQSPVFLKGDNMDKFYMMKVPYELPRDTFIRAIEIIPGNKKLVHHINAHLVQYEENEKTSLTSGKPFVDTEKTDKHKAYELLDLPNDDDTYPLLTPSVTNYLPGVEVTAYPDGIGGYKVRRRGVLLLDNIHYGPSPVDTTDQTTFNIFYSPVPPRRPVKEMILGTSGITDVTPPLIIQPDSISTFSTRYLVPKDMSILTINPHMHLLGKKFLAYAIGPGGDTIRLIRIPEWDFRWQYFYTFKNIVKIPKGYTIVATATFDNTNANPLNPFHPPRRVSERDGSMRTTDEMFQLIITWMPYMANDEFISLEQGMKNTVIE